MSNQQPTPTPELDAPSCVPEPETSEPEFNVGALEDEICQLLADFLHLHKKVRNGSLIVKVQNEQFAFVQVTFDRKPQVTYPLAS